MAAKPKTIENYVFHIATGITFLVSSIFAVALGLDLARAALFIESLYAINL